MKQVRTFDSKEKSIQFAQKEINDPTSKYRIEAVEFVREVKDVGSIPVLVKHVQDKDIQTFVIFALGDLLAYEATEVLIDLLDHPNPNVRGNAFNALGKIYPIDLPQGYVYGQNKIKRRGEIEKIRTWWQTNGEQITNEYERDLFTNEDANNKAWEKYGKRYLFAD